MNKPSINTSKKTACLRTSKKFGDKVSLYKSFRSVRKGKRDENRTTRSCLQQQQLQAGESYEREYQQSLLKVPTGLSQSELEHCIKLIVQNLDQAPFVQAVQTTPNFQLQHLQVSQEVLASPFVWMEVQQRLQNISPNALILVKEISQRESNCPLEKSNSKQQFDPVPLCKFGIQGDQNLGVNQDKELLHGKLGSCCDEGDDHHHHHQHESNDESHVIPPHAHLPYNNKISAPTSIPDIGEEPWQEQGSGSGLGLVKNKKSTYNNSINSYNIHTNYNGYGGAKQYDSESARCQTKTQHWGVVIQTQEMSLVQGCYLLTTSENRGQHGCSCTHFHLARVCKGMGLDYQLMNSWLGSSVNFSNSFSF